MTSSAHERWPARLRRALEGGEGSRYELRGEIGRGGMGVVHRAWDRQLNREVALKILREDCAVGVAAERFRREAQVAARLSHPNLVRVFDAGEQDGRTFLVMEYVEGRPLADLLRAKTADRPALLKILERAARGVAAAHAAGVVHRDLKPGNIIVDAAGEPKVVDFGLAHLIEAASALTRTGAALGTPSYMAPEQVGGSSREISPRTDVYGLGAILYEILTGRPPHVGDSSADILRRVVDSELEAPRRRDPGIGRDLETVAMKALEKPPARRYATAEEFADDLARVLAGEPIAARPVSAWTHLWRRGVRHHRALLAAAGVLFAVAAGLGLRAAVVADRRAKADADALRQLEIARPALEKAEAAFYTRDIDAAAAAAGVDRALELLLTAVETSPDLPQARLHLGVAWDLKGDDRKAEAEWRAAINLDPALGPAHFRLGSLLVLRAWAESLESYRPNSPFPDLEQAGRVAAEAARELGEAAGRSGQDDALERAIADAMLALVRKDTPRVAALCDAAIARFGKARRTEILHWMKGLASTGREEREAFDRAIEIRPKYPWALLCRALARVRGGDAPGAIEDCGAALAVDPRFPRPRLLRGNLRQQAKDYAGAIADFGELVRLDGTDRAAYFNRGTARVLAGDVDAAIGDYSECIRLLPSWPEPWNRRGNARARKGELNGAIVDFTECLRLRENDFYALLGRGLARSRLGEIEPAIADLEACVRIGAGLAERDVAAAELQRLKERREH